MSNFIALYVALLAFALGQVCSTVRADEEQFWHARAELACRAIADPKVASSAASRLLDIHLQREDVDRAKLMTRLLVAPKNRMEGHLKIAEQFSKNGKMEECQAELDRSVQFALNSRNHRVLTDAYVRIAHSPKKAIQFVRNNPTPKGIEDLCQSLARVGYLNEAFEVLEQSTDIKKPHLVRLKIAYAAGEAGLIEDTETAAKLINMPRNNEYYLQSIWIRLAEGLYKQKQYAAAKRYAELVTDQSVYRHHQNTLRKIKKGKPTAKVTKPKVGADTKPVARAFFGTVPKPLLQAAERGDIERVEQLIDLLMQEAAERPIREESGQFGPYNQKLRLATIKSHHLVSAKLHFDAGNHRAAYERMKLVESALSEMLVENSFFAMINAGQIFYAQIAMKNIDGLNRLTTDLPAGIWQSYLDPIVELLLAENKIDNAKTVIRKAFEDEQAMFGSHYMQPRNMLVTFYRANPNQETLSLIKTLHLRSFGTQAFETLGAEMLKTGKAPQLKEWLSELSPEQKAYLCIGASTTFLEQSG